MNNLDKYSREVFNTLQIKELSIFVKELEDLLRIHLSNSNNFESETNQIIEKLIYLGHPLFSLSGDSDLKRKMFVWGSGYRDSNANGLEIEFIEPNIVNILWISSSMRLIK